MRRNYTILGSCLVFIALCAYFVTNSKSYNEILMEKQEEMRVNVGKQIVIGKDTAIIINFDAHRGNYNLSNGLVIDKALVK